MVSSLSFPVFYRTFTEPYFQYFPLELVNEVLIHCKPNEISAVALANSNYRIEAERVLYRSIVFSKSTDPRTASCLSILTSIQSKANMVRSFELIDVGSEPFPRSELDRLFESLLAMRSLKHLRLNFSWVDEREIASLLLPVLKFVLTLISTCSCEAHLHLSHLGNVHFLLAPYTSLPCCWRIGY